MLKILIVILAYILGSISTSYMVGKGFARIDIRQYGSGNAGSTNVLRTLGKKAAAITFLGDCFKGVLAVYLGSKFGGEMLVFLSGIAVVVGHNWPVFLGFKGGKGIATTIGVAIMIHPFMALICIVFGIIMLYRYRYVSLASISAISLFPVTMIFVGFNYFVFALILCLMAIYRHKDNIQRLLKGTERRLGEKSSVK